MWRPVNVRAFKFRGPVIDGLGDSDHFQDRAGHLRRFLRSGDAPGGVGIAESGNFDLRDAGLRPDYRMGRPVGYDGAVGLDAMGQEVMGSGSFAAVGPRLVRPHRRTGNFTCHRRKNQVSSKGETALTDSLASDHERRQPRLHVGRAQTEDLAVPNRAPKLAVRFELPAEHSIFLGAGITRVHVTVDHERNAIASAPDNAHGIDSIGIDFLADRLDAMP